MTPEQMNAVLAALATKAADTSMSLTDHIAAWSAFASAIISAAALWATVHFYRKLVANDILRTQRDGAREERERIEAVKKEVSERLQAAGNNPAVIHDQCISLRKKFPHDARLILEVYSQTFEDPISFESLGSTGTLLNRLNLLDPGYWPSPKEWLKKAE
jgi:hypothetical protein